VKFTHDAQVRPRRNELHDTVQREIRPGRSRRVMVEFFEVFQSAQRIGERLSETIAPCMEMPRL
jgi:hypothetical protein